MRNFRETDLKRTKRGDFRRGLGRTPDGKEVKFALGFDRALAQKRMAAILCLWEACCKVQICRTADGKPAWDESRLEAARQLAKGNRPENPEPDDLAYGGIVAASRHDVGSPPHGIEEEQEAATIKLGRAFSPPFGPNKQRLTGQKLFEALEAYRKHIGKEYRDGAGNLTDNGKTKQDQLNMLKSYLTDCDLGMLDYHGCDDVYGVFRRRPITKRHEKPMAYKTCQNLLGELTRFFNWLHKAAEFEWRKPEDFDLIKKLPQEIDEDSEKESQPIPTWTLKELKTLWEYALPLERVLIALGLNCSYGADQAGRLRVHHVKFADTDGGITFIRRIRRKKRTLSVHALWAVTVKALKWAIERRPVCDLDHVLLNQEGHPLWRLTKGSNRSQDIPNMWNRLLDRVEKDKEGFRRLPFNSLRDTSGDFVRRIAGGEVASLHLAHKHQTRDENLRRYTNPLTRRHTKALLKLEAKLESIFSDVRDPFPVDMKRVQSEGQVPNISRGKIRRIQKLYLQGYKQAKIAEMVGVSRQTVSRHCEEVTRPNPRTESASSQNAEVHSSGEREASE